MIDMIKRFINWIRYQVALTLQQNMMPLDHIDEFIRKRWNHLEGVKLTRGRIKIDWRIVWQGRKQTK